MIPKDNPIVFWNDRERQRIYESDLTSNYHLLKTYLLKFGGKSPVPELSHHEAHRRNVLQNVESISMVLLSYISIMNLHIDCKQAAMVLLSATYNIHAPLYGKRGGRGQIRVPGY